MERLGLGQVLNTSFSLHSVAEGSEIISEAEEIQEVYNLQSSGSRALETRNYDKALRCYEDALEIDEYNVDSLCGRAGVYLELGKFVLAQLDAEKVLANDPKNPKALSLQGEALGNLGYYRESLVAFLKALDLDNECKETVALLSDNIASMSAKYCPMIDKLYRKLPSMDSYKKLCEVGASLYQGRRYDLCIRVLNTAQKLETQQQGITMKLLLTLGNAHLALQHNELAVSLYQDCLSIAESVHDVPYQTKTLVSIASLFLEMNETHRAILYYEKLLDLQNDLQGERSDGPLPDYWTKDLQCALHLNLSIAYKSIGDVDQAVQHAETYMKLIEGQDILRVNAEALSQQNIGVLHEVLGHYNEAFDHYKKFLSLSRKKGDKKGVAQAYGCLGGIHGKLGNIPLAKTYHEQYTNSAKSLKDEKLITLAHEQFGDTYIYLEKYEEAVEQYLHMLHSCSRNDMQNKTKSLCKVGKAYRAQKRFQYSIYYFEQAKVIADDFKMSAIKTVCEYNLACIMQHSTQMKELTQANNYLQRLIPVMEEKVTQHKVEGTHCPQELLAELQECYRAIQVVLTKLGESENSLLYAEASRWSLCGIKPADVQTGVHNKYEMWSPERVKRIIDGQNSTVVYYTLLEDSYLIWVLQPGQGIVRFYQWKSQDKGYHLVRELQNQINRITEKKDHSADTEYENRSLPYRDEALSLIIKKNARLAAEEPAEDGERSQADPSLKAPEQVLFRMLLAPVYDILLKLEEGSTVIFVPDQCLYDCPFGALMDWNGCCLGDKFSITSVSDLHCLAKAVQNELKWLKLVDSQEFERTQSRLGGVSRILHGELGTSPDDICGSRNCQSVMQSRPENGRINLKKISNPKLITSNGMNGTRSLETNCKTRTGVERCNGLKRSSDYTKRPVPLPPKTTRSAVPIGTTASLEKMAGLQFLSTLTAKTSTNTDITTSTSMVTDFQQVCEKDRCMVIGNPTLPEKLRLHDKPWCPRLDLKAAQGECYRVAEHLNVTANVGNLATKQRFLKDLETATVIHIATRMCLKEGYIVLAPDPAELGSDPPDEASYIVTAEELDRLSLCAKLVVLSGGWGVTDKPLCHTGYRLPSAFIRAGCQCVLMTLWPVPNCVLQKFYHNFYRSLRGGHKVAAAVRDAAHILKEDRRFESKAYWMPWQLVGKDTDIDLLQIHHAMLDQDLNRIEEEVGQVNSKAKLNLDPVHATVADREENLQILQQCVVSLLGAWDSLAAVINPLVDLCDRALKRLQAKESDNRTSVLPDAVVAHQGALRLLKHLGFRFQAQGADTRHPYVLYPPSDRQNLVTAGFNSLRAITDIMTCPLYGKALCKMLPQAQDTLSHLVDMLCITKNSPGIQLKVTDLSIKSLWTNSKVKNALTQMGFHQIGILINFNRVPSKKKLLSGSLQLMIALSTQKTSILQHKLDVNLLGIVAKNKEIEENSDPPKLQSMSPVMLQRKQIKMSSPWMSTVENQQEMQEKIKLAERKTELFHDLRSDLGRTRSWHELMLKSQANEALDQIGRPKSASQKVKVIPITSQTSPRIPVDHQMALTKAETDQRRDYANYILQERIQDISVQHRNDERRLYLPYILNPGT